MLGLLNFQKNMLKNPCLAIFFRKFLKIFQVLQIAFFVQTRKNGMLGSLNLLKNMLKKSILSNFLKLLFPMVQHIFMKNRQFRAGRPRNHGRSQDFFGGGAAFQKIFFRTQLKMHYFSIFFKKFNKPCVSFLRVRTKNTIYWKF